MTVAKLTAKRYPLEMHDLAQLLRNRRGEIPYEDLAREIDIKTSTLFRQLVGQRVTSLVTLRKLAKWAHKKKDEELLDALATYALGLDVRVTDKSSP